MGLGEGLQAVKVPGQLKCFVAPTKEQASTNIAEYIAEQIRQRSETDAPYVLGLATGSTPIPIYKELARLQKEGSVSFKNVVSINLDEYYPIQPEDENSYHYFMNEQFFKFVDFESSQNFIPQGNIDQAQVASHCEEYEKRIREHGIDIQILGIGRSGHIGFNEPGSTLDSRTRLVQLHRQTIVDAGPAFGGEENVPTQAITMGIDSIFQARQCILCAWGSGKKEIVKKALESEPSSDVPATFLQSHPNAVFILDQDASPFDQA